MADNFFEPATAKIFVTVQRKVNLGNFESCEITMGLSQLDINSEDDDISACLAQVSTVAGRLIYNIEQKVRKVRLEDYDDETKSV